MKIAREQLLEWQDHPITQLVKTRAEQLKDSYSRIDSIPIDVDNQKRGEYVIAFQNYSGAITDVMDFEELLSEDITDDTTEL